MRKLLAGLAAILCFYSMWPSPAMADQGLCSGAASCFSSVGDTPFFATLSTSAAQILAVPAVATQAWHITAYSVSGTESATGGTVELVYGTGVNCATGQTVLAKLATMGATAASSGYGQGNGTGDTIVAPAGKAVCLLASAGTVVDGGIQGVATLR